MCSNQSDQSLVPVRLSGAIFASKNENKMAQPVSGRHGWLQLPGDNERMLVIFTNLISPPGYLSYSQYCIVREQVRQSNKMRWAFLSDSQKQLHKKYRRWIQKKVERHLIALNTQGIMDHMPW